MHSHSHMYTYSSWEAGGWSWGINGGVISLNSCFWPEACRQFICNSNRREERKRGRKESKRWTKNRVIEERKKEKLQQKGRNERTEKDRGSQRGLRVRKNNQKTKITIWYEPIFLSWCPLYCDASSSPSRSQFSSPGLPRSPGERKKPARHDHEEERRGRTVRILSEYGLS